MKVRGFTLRWWQVSVLAIAATWQIAWTWALIRWALTQPSGEVVTILSNGVAALTLFSTPPVVLVAIVVATTGHTDKPDRR